MAMSIVGSDLVDVGHRTRVPFGLHGGGGDHLREMIVALRKRRRRGDADGIKTDSHTHTHTHTRIHIRVYSRRQCGIGVKE